MLSLQTLQVWTQLWSVHLNPYLVSRLLSWGEGTIHIFTQYKARVLRDMNEEDLVVNEISEDEEERWLPAANEVFWGVDSTDLFVWVEIFLISGIRGK